MTALLLVTTGKVAADDIPVPARSAAVHVDLDAATLAQLRAHREEHFAAVWVVASTWARLRAAVLPLRLLGETAELTVRVIRDTQGAGRVPAMRPVPRTRVVHFSASAPKGGGTTIELGLSRPAAVHELVSGVSGGASRVLAHGLRIALADRGAERFAIGCPDVRYAGIDDVIDAGGTSVGMTDVVLAAGDQSPADERPHIRADAGAETGAAATALAIPPVDTRVINPIGFDNGGHDQSAHLTVASTGHLVLERGDGTDLGRVPRDGLISAPQIRRLRKVRGVLVDPLPPEHDVALATVLTQLASAGIPLLLRHLSSGVAHALGPELAAAAVASSADCLADPLCREAVSIRMRREALRRHSTAAVWAEVGRRAGQQVPDLPTVSVVLTTRRPHNVDFALRQIAQQTYRRMEIVLGLHGDGFDTAAVHAALDRLSLPYEVVATPADVPFGTAVQRAFEACAGRLVTKWDDDDLYGSEHLWDLVLAADYSGADVVGKAAEFTLLETLHTMVRGTRSNERFVRHVAGGTIMMRRDTWSAVGGWRPVSRSVDGILLRQIVTQGGSIYRTHGLGYVLRRHGDGHTWDPQSGAEYFLGTQGERWTGDAPLELILEQTPGTTP